MLLITIKMENKFFKNFNPYQMTKDQKKSKAKMIQEITELIADKELKFGCEVENPGGVNTVVKVDERGVVSFKETENCYVVMPETILGTPVDLTKVLWWMDKKYAVNLYTPRQNYGKEENCADIQIHKLDSNELIGTVFWDLLKPLLRDQSEETVRLIHSLIFTNE